MHSGDPHRIDQYQQLRAEALCAELADNGLPFDELVIRMEGAFRRSYRNDIEQVESLKDRRGKLLISVNRDGIYDRLPEGLFHQTRGSGHTASLSDMVGEYKRYREEEKLARKFFQPLEQELFRYAVLTEQEERKLQFGMLKGKLEAEFYRFWNIGISLPHGPASVLVLMMPWIREIKGDLQLTVKALSMMLDKPVTATLSVVEEQADEASGFRLGEGAAMLGMDTVCGSRFSEPYIQWIFTIGALEPQEMIAYTPGKPLGRFLERFEELFIPLEAEAKFEYHCLDTPEEMTEPILGYGFYL